MEDSTIGEGNKRKKEVNVYRCSRCHAMITYEGKLGQKIKIECHNCGKKSMIEPDLKKPEKMLPVTKNKSKDENLSSEKKPIKDYTTLVEKTRSQFSEKITLHKKILILFASFVIVMILSLLFIETKNGNIYIELLYVSIFIGIMVIRERIDEFIPHHLKKKVNIITSVFIVMFFGIVINEIIGLIST